MAQPRSWRPFLTAVRNDPVKLCILERQFPRHVIETATHINLVEIHNGKWVCITDNGDRVLRACELSLKRRAAAEDALALLEQAREALQETDKGARFQELRFKIARFVSELT